MSFGDGRYFPQSRPRAVRGGIRSESQRGSFGSNWWSMRWIRVLEEFQLGARLSRGRSYARLGQVLSIDIAKGAITAKVQGSRPRPYEVLIRLKPLSRSDWRRVAQAISGQAKYVSKLLAGEMPMELEDLFLQSKAPLFPEGQNDLVTDCSCPDASNPCKHVAAVYCLLAEELDRDPFLLFKLRGMERDELFALINEDSAGPSAVDPPESRLPEIKPEPLPQSRHAYWTELRTPPDLLAAKPSSTEGAALPRRLGSLPFWRGESPLLQSLDQIYWKAGQLATDWMEGTPTELPGLQTVRSARARAARKAYLAGEGPAPPVRISDELIRAIRRIWPLQHVYDFDYEMESHLDPVGRKLERELRNLPARFFRFHCLTVEGPPRSYMLYFLGDRFDSDFVFQGWLLGVSMLEPVAVLQFGQFDEGSEVAPSLSLDAVTDEAGNVRLASLRRDLERILKKYKIRLLNEEECHAVVPELTSVHGKSVTVFEAFFYEAIENLAAEGAADPI